MSQTHEHNTYPPSFGAKKKRRPLSQGQRWKRYLHAVVPSVMTPGTTVVGRRPNVMRPVVVVVKSAEGVGGVKPLVGEPKTAEQGTPVPTGAGTALAPYLRRLLIRLATGLGLVG